MRWHNGGNEKVRIWSIFNTLFGHMERKCGERKRPTCFYLFYNKKDFFFFFLCCKRYIQEYDEVELSALGMGTFSSNFFCITFSSVLYPNKKKIYIYIYIFFFFLFHLLNNWGKRKKTQNLIEIWFSCAIYNQLWVEDFIND